MDETRFTAARAVCPDVIDPGECVALEGETVHCPGEGAEWRPRFVEGCRRRRREELAARSAARKFEAQIARLFVVPGEV